MKPTFKISLAALAVVAVVIFSYWLGVRSNHAPGSAQPEVAEQVKSAPKILYYRNPMGLPDTSDVPKKDSMGMDYIPVYEEAAAPAQAKSARKILYYRNPMGLPDTSSVPKKDSMGMDYIAVYEGEEEESSASGTSIKISADKVQKLGVKTEKAALRQLSHSVRAVGRIEPDERRVYTVSPKFEGWVDQLHVNATGDAVKAGQALFEVYSPDLISAQREYLIAVQGMKSMQDAVAEAQSSMKDLAQASLMRLKSWDIGDEDLRRLRETGEVKRTIPYRSPVSGIVIEKTAIKGMRFMPGEALYKIADLSTVWIIADVSEQESGLVRAGQAAKIRLDAYPGREFSSRVSYVYPTLNQQTRTTPVRLEVANAAGLLRPGMYAEVTLSGLGSKGRVVTVPDSAVIYSGRRELVLVELAEGRYEARAVKLGARTDDYVEIAEGVGEGEKVVVSANFLIDAESNLKAVISGFSQGEPSSAPAAAQPSH
jgi:Cu(I)/Ag(I) efflux system membrane fusion protein